MLCITAIKRSVILLDIIKFGSHSIDTGAGGLIYGTASYKIHTTITRVGEANPTLIVGG